MNYLPTFNDFLENPMGRGSNVLTSRNLIRSDLEQRYLKLAEKKKNQFKVKIYKNKTNFYFHIIIPSESERGNNYDVVIHFTPPNDVNTKTLQKYHIRIFSNSPSFVYTYAYTVNLYDFLVQELKDKFRDVVLKQKPVIRNPYETISYEKTVTFAMFHLLYKGYLDVNVAEKLSQKFNKKSFVDSIRTDDQIKIDIQKAKNKLKKKQSKKEDEKAASNNKSRKGVIKPIISNTKNPERNRNTDGKVIARTKRGAKPKVKPKAKR